MTLNLNELYKVKGTILLTGETGTGKSYLAKKIHEESERKNSPFIEMNLATMSDSLIESELFGHSKGAFTGAVNDRRGYCEVVRDGTLFLDEIAEISLSSQMKLLRLLEEKKFTPVGSCCVKKFEGRIIAATNKNLTKLVNEGKFRKDLYFRLKVFTYELLPLRERMDELDYYIDLFMDKFNFDLSKKINLKDGDRRELYNRKWFGNIRELKNCIEYFVTCEHFPSWKDDTFLEESTSLNNAIDKFPEDYYSALELFERSYFSMILHKNMGRINLTAEKLGISKSTLIMKLKKYNINSLLIRANLKYA